MNGPRAWLLSLGNSPAEPAGNGSSSSAPAVENRLPALLAGVLPWLIFAAFMLWSWGWRDLSATLPHYGDMMETVVGTMWLDEALSTGQNPLIYPLNYFPEGWRVASHSAGMIIPLLLLPVSKLGGPVLAVNVAMLLSCLVAYLGAYLAARYYVGHLMAVLPALAFTFWAMRWYELMGGIMQIFLGSALMPWMIWSVERANRSERRRAAWLLLAGALWAVAFMMSQYFAVAGAAVLFTWILLWQDGETPSWRRRLADLALAIGACLLVSAPWLFLNLRETRLADPAYYGILEVNSDSASLNSLPVPFLYHPWLGPLARRIFTGPPWEPSVANLGFTASLLAVFGAALAIKRRAWRPILALAALGLLLTVGMTVHWNARSVSAPLLQPLNQALWQLGHALKPSFFTTPAPPIPLDTAIPLPAYLLTVLMPFFERGRMFSRYGLIAVFGIYMLAGLALTRLRQPWQKALLGGILIFALVPPRLEAIPWPPQLHPGFTWLSQNLRPGEGIINVVGIHPSTMGTVIGGETFLASQLHRLPTASGTAGVKPRHAQYLEDWLATHQHPFWQPDLAPILKAYAVRYVAIQMEGEWEPELWEEAQVADDFTAVGCFDPVAAGQPWDWPVCVVEVTPKETPQFNVLFHDGWSGMEDWGVWSESTEAATEWIATAREPFDLTASAFPQCLPGIRQRVELEVNGELLAAYQWPDCEPWTTVVAIPPALVRVGANDLIVRSAYALPPVENSGEKRNLAVGFTTLRVDPVQARSGIQQTGEK